MIFCYQVKSATMGRSHKNDDGGLTIPSKVDEVHEYHEITDTDTVILILTYYLLSQKLQNTIIASDSRFY